MKKKLYLFLSFLFLFINLSLLSQSSEKINNSIILQAFHWKSCDISPWWKVVSDKVPDIASSKFDMVWLPPSGASASKEGYLPNRWYCQDSFYGTKEQLKNLIRKFHSYNIKVIADIVINHRVGTYDWADFTEPTWGSNAVCKDDEWSGATGNYDTGYGFNAGRDIDHTQHFVQQDIIKWLNWLKSEIGYDGWRFDYVKGYDGYYVSIYIKETHPYFSVGEFWDYLDINNPNYHRQQLCDWINKSHSHAFDFTTKGMLQYAIRHSEYWRLRDNENKPIGLIGWWSEMAVTFIDNHDTGPSPNDGQNHWPFPSDKVMEGYAYILTHPGIPCVYWVHFYDWGLHDKIKRLIEIRKNNNINAKSKVRIIVADNSKYCAIIDEKIALKIGYGDWTPGNEWEVILKDKDYIIWGKKKNK